MSECISDKKSQFADVFYNSMLANDSAAAFLTHSKVREKLHPSMQRWLSELFLAEPDIDEVIATQKHIGEIHSRIGIPMNLIIRGALYLKAAIYSSLLDKQPERTRKAPHQQLVYVSHSIDYAIEIMSSAYSEHAERKTRTDETYRAFSLSYSMLVEKERQRAALLDWENQIIYSLAFLDSREELPRISRSDFGLWYTHKGIPIFSESPESSELENNLKKIDSVLLPLCESRTRSGDLSSRNHAVREIQDEITQLKYLLSTLFERVGDIEAGKDSLTRLLNRRFLPAVLDREINLNRRINSSFSVLLLDIDHFKSINDDYGHSAGDVVLQQVSTILLNATRGGDYVFRYGGEEFLMVLVEVSLRQSVAIAEKICRQMRKAAFVLPGKSQINVCVSIGVACFDGHPDHRNLINRADEALLMAKNSGRNKVVVADEGASE